MRHLRTLLATLTITLASMAGCLGDDPSNKPTTTNPPPTTTPATHVLVNSLEPQELEAPTFNALGAIARGGPAYGAGEPSIWAALDGSITVAFPGCDRGFYLVTLPTQQQCDHGLIYRSTDDGTTWTRLNRDGDGRYTDDGPAANNDADVAVDAAGTIWASNLGGGGIQIHRSTDNGTTWTYVTDVVPENQGADRQWMATAGPGHLIVTWMRTSPSRDVAVNTTLDGGQNWTGTFDLGSGIGWLGSVQIAPNGQTAYIPFTQPVTGTNLLIAGTQEFGMYVARSMDGGLTWEVLDTGARWKTPLTGGHWSGVHMAPSLDVTGDGTVVLAYSIDRYATLANSVTTPTSTGASIMVMQSHDNGTTWSQPTPLPALTEISPGIFTDATSAIMPWVTGGAGDRVAITYMQTTSPLDNDYGGTTWDIRATIINGIGTENQERVEATIDTNIHQGGICTRGSSCLLTGSDRALLDFFEADLLPDGRLIVTYPADPLTNGKYIEIRIGIQNGGTPLLVRAP